MANVVTLHKRQVFLPTGLPADGAQALFYLSGTATQVSVYSDVTLLTERAQPVVCDANGVLPVCYVADGTALRILITDEDDVALPGYPMDNIVPEPTEDSVAAEISFSATELLPYSNVQEAIEGASELLEDQTGLISRANTVWPTGGTGNAYTVTPSPAITAYASGQAFLIRPDRDNTGASTLNVNGLGARSLQKTNSSGTATALVAGEIKRGREFFATDDGAKFLIALGRDFPVTGSDTNGFYIRFPNGVQACWKTTLEVPFESSGACAAGWTFPAAFTTVMHVSATVVGGALIADTGQTPGAATTNITGREVGSVSVGPRTTTSAVIRVWSTNGADAFVSGDKMYVSPIAFGLWT